MSWSVGAPVGELAACGRERTASRSGQTDRVVRVGAAGPPQGSLDDPGRVATDTGSRSPLGYLDATGEPLAGLLRPGNAGSGTAADYVAALSDSLAQPPVDAHEHEVICRSDSAGASHAFLDACRERHVRFVIGHPLTAEVASTVLAAPPSAWVPAISADVEGWSVRKTW